jgi:hypothetical protein
MTIFYAHRGSQHAEGKGDEDFMRGSDDVVEFLKTCEDRHIKLKNASIGGLLALFK